MLKRTYLILAVFAATSAQAQVDSTRVGTCEPGSATAVLDVGNVQARVFNGGNLFYGRGFGALYEVPKGSGFNATFADNLLIGGMVDGELRMSASSYGPYEMWPGPIPADGSPPADCARYDKIWSLDSGAFDIGSINHAPGPQILEWPDSLGAEYHELDGIPGYTPLTGDRPLMRGDQMHWWIMNDLGNVHDRSKANPLGIEVRASAYAFNFESVDNVTFYRYRITNRSSDTIRDTYIGRFSDVDMGDPWDDYVGSDSTLSLMYFYNAVDEDGGANGFGYGAPAPAFGLTMLEASHSRGGLPSDMKAGPEAFLTSIIAPNKSGPFGFARDAKEYYNYLQGIWNNGRSMTYGGFGWDWESPTTKYIYTGDPVTRSFWTQMNYDEQGSQFGQNDKRAIVGFGPFILEPGDSATFTYAFVWARGTDHLDSVVRLKNLTAFIHDRKDALIGPRTPSGTRFIDGNPPTRPQYPFWLATPYPNPTSGLVTFEYSLSLDGHVALELYDVMQRRVARIDEGRKIAGRQKVRFNTSDLVPGVYQLRLTQGRRLDSVLFVVL